MFQPSWQANEALLWPIAYGAVTSIESLNFPNHLIGQAIFIRTGVPDYDEVARPFQTLEEMVKLCSEPLAGLTLERVIIYSMLEGQPCALTLGFISASKSFRPNSLKFNFKD